MKVLVTCAGCGTEFAPREVKERNFCTHACYHAERARNKGRGRNRVQVACAACGKRFFVAKHREATARYCSATCKRGVSPTAVRLSCEYCGKEFIRKAAEIGKRSYCGRPCWKASRRMPVNCDNCGKQMHRHQYEIKKHNFCSYQCSGEWRKSPVFVNCTHCGRVIETIRARATTNRFCNKRCYYRWNDGYSTVKCTGCGREFRQRKHKVMTQDRLFCTPDCFYKWGTGENSATWRGGKSFEPYPVQFNGRLKREIRHRDRDTCQLCGVLTTKGDRACHHIDYQKHNSAGRNLILLCTRCHGRTNYNRHIWKRVLEAYQRARGIS